MKTLDTLQRKCYFRSCSPPVPHRQRIPRPRIRLRIHATSFGAATLSPDSKGRESSDFVSLLKGLPKAALEWWTVESPAKRKQPEANVKLGPVLAKLWSLCVPDIPMLALASSFMVVASLCELAIPHYATKSIFAASVSTSSSAFSGYLSILTCMVTMYGIAAALRGFCFSILNNRMTRRLRAELFSSLARRETAFFDGEDVGNLTSRLQSDCQAMTKVIATNANIAIRNFLQAVGSVAYLFMLSPSLCGVTVAISAVLWAVTLVYGAFARRMQKVFQDVLAESNVVAEEALTLSRVVRTFGTESTETKRYATWLDRLYAVGKRQAAGYAIFIATGHIACYASKVAALAIGCVMVLKGQLTAEQLTNFIMYVEFVTYASLNVCDEFTEICEAVGASERVVAMLDAPPAPQIAAGETLPNFTGRISLQDVRFSYPSRPSNTALDDVSITFQPGKLTALVGLSGSGKTTVCALLQRLYDPTSGVMLLDDSLELRRADAAWYRRQIGVVPQEPRLFSRSIAANIVYGLEDNPPSQEEIEEAARSANAHEFIMALPEGYKTLITDKLLSGGQKQRLALARALVRKPKVLVLDEFSSALDAESEAQVNAALDRAMTSRDRTVIVIAHRLSTVRHADCIVVMDKGKVHEMGSHLELLARRGIYWQLVCRQQYGIDPNAAGATDTDSDTILAAAAKAAAEAAAAAASAVSGASAGIPDANGTGSGGGCRSAAEQAGVRSPFISPAGSFSSSRDSIDVEATCQVGMSITTSSGRISSSTNASASSLVVASSTSSSSSGTGLSAIASTTTSASVSSSGRREEAFLAAAAAAQATSELLLEEEEQAMGGGGSASGGRLGAATDDASGAGDGDAAEAEMSGGADGNGASDGGSVVVVHRTMGSLGTLSSLASLEEDNDEAGRPAAAAAAGRMSAVLAGVVLSGPAPSGTTHGQQQQSSRSGQPDGE